jgi:hypothetical protein
MGPFAGLVFNQYDKLICPPPIVAARAALARTPAVKKLRPQALGVKLLAVAATAATLNIPCGMWREHVEKFSVEWFIAIHATIPFVAMLRKAVIMPKFAIAVTIGAAVLGQVVGSRLERLRLQQQREQEANGGTTAVVAGFKAVPAAAAGVAGVPAVSGAGGAERGSQGKCSGLDGQSQVRRAKMCREEMEVVGGGGFLGLGNMLQELPVVRC